MNEEVQTLYVEQIEPALARLLQGNGLQLRCILFGLVNGRCFAHLLTADALDVSNLHSTLQVLRSVTMRLRPLFVATSAITQTSDGDAYQVVSIVEFPGPRTTHISRSLLQGKEGWALDLAVPPTVSSPSEIHSNFFTYRPDPSPAEERIIQSRAEFIASQCVEGNGANPLPSPLTPSAAQDPVGPRNPKHLH